MELNSGFQNFFKGDGVFDEILHLRGEVFREHKNRKTLRIMMDGKGYFVKLHRRTGLREVLKNLLSLRRPVISAENELRAIRRLEKLGIDTMNVVGFGMRGLPPAWLDSFIITEELENTVSLEHFCRDWSTHAPDFHLKSAIIRKVADIARRLHENGMNHRDFYICHFLLDLKSLTERKTLRIYLIDLHRVQIRKYTPERWIVKDLAGLFFSGMDIGLTERDVFRFMKAYTGKPLRVLLRENSSFWGRVYERAVRLYVKHFKRPPGLRGFLSSESLSGIRSQVKGRGR